QIGCGKCGIQIADTGTGFRVSRGHGRDCERERNRRWRDEAAELRATSDEMCDADHRVTSLTLTAAKLRVRPPAAHRAAALFRSRNAPVLREPRVLVHQALHELRLDRRSASWSWIADQVAPRAARRSGGSLRLRG